MLTALGVAAGVWLHVCYTLVGVGLLIQQSAWLFHAIKLAAAAYLIWLGLALLRARPAADAPAAGGVAPMSDWAAWRMGFLTNALNPKTTLFIVSLFMQVLQPGTPLAIQLGYGAFISLAHGLWFTLVALCFSSTVVRARLQAVRPVIDRVFGGLLAGLGVLLVLVRHER